MTSVSRRRAIVGAAWATPAVLIATATPAAAASPNAPATVMGRYRLDHFGGGAGWTGVSRDITVQLQFAMDWLDAWPPALVVPTTWLITISDTAGTPVATRSGTAGVTHASGVQARETMRMPAAGTYRVTFLVTAGAVTQNGVVYQVPNLVSTQPLTFTVS